MVLCWKLAVVFFDDRSLFLMVALPNVNVLLPRVGFSITLTYCLTTNDLLGLVWACHSLFKDAFHFENVVI